MATITFLLTIGATALNGIAAGATLDQAIKQLPARHKIGLVAYSNYSKAADLGNGILWYVSLGISAVVLTLAAAIAALLQQITIESALPIYIAALLSLSHSIVTSQAAPMMFSQRQHAGDEVSLKAIFNRFERLNALRAIFQVLTFISLLWAVVIYIR